MSVDHLARAIDIVEKANDERQSLGAKGQEVLLLAAIAEALVTVVEVLRDIRRTLAEPQ